MFHVTPSKPSGTSSKPRGTFSKPRETPIKSRGTPSKPRKTPIIPRGTPSKPRGTHSESHCTPFENHSYRRTWCRDGVVVSSFICRSEGPWFDFTLRLNFFEPIAFGVNPACKKMGTWGFPRTAKTAKTGAGMMTSL